MPDNPTSNPASIASGLPTGKLGDVGDGSRDRKSKSSIDFKSVASRKNVSHLIELTEDLRAITSVAENSNELVQRILDAVAIRGRLFGVAWVDVQTDGRSEVKGARFKSPAMDTVPIRKQFVDSAMMAIQQSTPQILKSEIVRGSLVACVPFFKNDQTTAVICGMLPDDQSKCAEALLICQSVAEHFAAWRSRDQLKSMAMEVRSTAAVLELVGRTECSETLKEACLNIANELQELFRCDFVAVGLKRSKIASCQLIAVSAVAEFDRQSRTTALIRSSFDEANLRGQYTSFPSPPGRNDGPALSHKKLAQHLRCECAVTIPLKNQRDESIGAITILGNRGIDRNAASRNLIKALEHPIGSCLEVVRLVEGGWLRKIHRTFVSKEKTKTKWAVAAAVLIVIIAMMIPVPYRIHSSCTAEPVIRSFSVAPHEGLLENTFVEPGDVVTKGQLLAKMDGREIGSKISRTLAERNRAAREHDSFLAGGQISESIRADLERRGFDAQLDMLMYQQQNLEIKSQQDGIVLSGSIDKRENFPVTIGQSLYEIAPLTPLRVELAIPADEIMHVEPGQKVKFRFDGFGTETIEGIVDRIRPSSTIRNDKNVFIAEAVLQNEGGEVRPGMNGYANVFGSNRTLGWSIFHQPWERFVTAIGF